MPGLLKTHEQENDDNVKLKMEVVKNIVDSQCFLLFQYNGFKSDLETMEDELSQIQELLQNIQNRRNNRIEQLNEIIRERCQP